MPKPLGTYGGREVIQDFNVPFVLKYPSGKKDGNKLGKRKRKMGGYEAILYQNKIILHPTIYNELLTLNQV